MLAEWPVEVDWWYPGVVVAQERGQVLVQFDDGDRAAVGNDAVQPLGTIGVGQHVHGRFQGGRSYYPGRITARSGDAIHIVYEDGDQEWTSIALVRVARNFV